MNTSTNTVKGLLITVVILIGFNAGQFAWVLSAGELRRCRQGESVDDDDPLAPCQ